MELKMGYEELLEKKGIEVIDNLNNNSFKCKYNNNNIMIERNSGINNNYRVAINGKTIITRGNLITCIARILNYK